MITSIKLFIGLLFGVAYVFLTSIHQFSALNLYAIGFIILFGLFPPRTLISPLTIIHLFYFVFYVFAPSFAELHSQDNFASKQFVVAYFMIYFTHLFATIGGHLGSGGGCKILIYHDNLIIDKRVPFGLNLSIFLLFVLSTAAVIAIIVSTHGFQYWINSPGDAFLTRAGSGAYVVISHFSTFLLASLTGYATYRYKNVKYLILFLAWLIVTSPVHGSKQLLMIFIALVFLPWLKDLKPLNARALLFGVLLTLVFFFGLYLRKISWVTLDQMLPVAFNYFTALRNLVMLIEDFEPGFMQTFFLPFNKFLTPFGLSDPGLYFDMNHMLTDKYFPHAWEIRATEQWPVEADLYLNFYFFWGLPLIAIFTYVIGRIHREAVNSGSLGIWVVALLLIFSIPSSLRGSLYNHTHFYLWPMFFVIYLILRNFSLDSSAYRGSSK